MKQREQTGNSRIRERAQMADWAMFVSLPSIKHPLMEFKPAELRRLRSEQAFTFLLKKGCDQLALETSLLMAKTISARGMPKANRVKSVAAKMHKLADEISRLESSYFLVAQEFEEIKMYTPDNFYDTVLFSKSLRSLLPEFLSKHAEMSLDWGIAAHTVHDTLVKRKRDGLLSTRFPHFVLPEFLNKRAQMYKDWLDRAQDKVPPRADLLSRVERMCPTLYVRWATKGNCFCDKVVNLLRLAGVVKPYDADGNGFGGKQLNRELRAFEVDYPLTRFEIVRLLKRVHRHELTWQTTARQPSS